MTDIVSSFQDLVRRVQLSDSPEAELLLSQLSDSHAERLRLCALPHSFNATILTVLDPALAEAEAEATIAELQQLPSVIQAPEGWALHDVVRQQLFRQWLTPAHIDRMKVLSRRLVDYFRPAAGDAPATAEVRTRAWIFHSIGANFEQGFEELRQVYRERRVRANYSDCAALLRLAREYEDALPAPQRAYLDYLEAEIACDTRDWPRALSMLNALAQQDLTQGVRRDVIAKLASVLRSTRDFVGAKASCLEAQAMSKVLNDSGAYMAEHELGLIARDEGDFDSAEHYLTQALALARQKGQPSQIVVACNSLGTLHLRNSPTKAVALFEECLAQLQSEPNTIRKGQILNNLALAYADLNQWDKSEIHYRNSLEIKRASADLHGEAVTQLNVARVYSAAGKPAEAQSALASAAVNFEALRDFANAARAHGELARRMRTHKQEEEAKQQAAAAIQFFERGGYAQEAWSLRREFGFSGDQRSLWRRILLWLVIGLHVLFFLFGLLLLTLLVVFLVDRNWLFNAMYEIMRK